MINNFFVKAYLTLSPNPASNLIAQEIFGEPPLPYMKTFDGDLNTPRLKDDDLFFKKFKLILFTFDFKRLKDLLKNPITRFIWNLY